MRRRRYLYTHTYIYIYIYTFLNPTPTPAYTRPTNQGFGASTSPSVVPPPFTKKKTHIIQQLMQPPLPASASLC